MEQPKKTSLRMNGWQAFGATGIMILATLLLIPVTMILSERLGFENGMLANYLIVMLISMSAILFIWKVRYTADEFAVKLHHVMIIPLLIVVTLALVAGIISPLQDLIPLPDSVKEILLKMLENRGIPSFIMMVIAAPVLEELLFRGVILKGLLNRYKPGMAIVISSVLFGIAHLNPWQFIAAFVLGVFIGWIYQKTSSLILPMFIHATANLNGYLSSYFFDTKNMDIRSMLDMKLVDYYGGWMNYVLIIAGCLVLVVASVYMIRRQFPVTTSLHAVIDTQATNDNGASHGI